MSIADQIAGQMANAGKPRVSKSTTTTTSNEETGILDAILPILQMYMYATMFANPTEAKGGGLSKSDIASGFSLAPKAAPGEFSLSGNYGAAPMAPAADPIAVASALGLSPAPSFNLASPAASPFNWGARTPAASLPASPMALPGRDMNQLDMANAGLDPLKLLALLGMIPQLKAAGALTGGVPALYNK